MLLNEITQSNVCQGLNKVLDRSTNHIIPLKTDISKLIPGSPSTMMKQETRQNHKYTSETNGKRIELALKEERKKNNNNNNNVR